MAKKVHSSPHRYERFAIGKKRDYIVYKCTLPDCSHYLSVAMMIGAKFLCECGQTGVIETKDQILKTLRCEECRANADIPMEEVIKVLEKVPPDE